MTKTKSVSRLKTLSPNAFAQTRQIATLLFGPEDLIEVYPVLNRQENVKRRTITPARDLGHAALELFDDLQGKIDGLQFGINPVTPAGEDPGLVDHNIICVPGVPSAGLLSEDRAEALRMLPPPNVVVYRGQLSDWYWKVLEKVDAHRAGYLVGAVAMMLFDGQPNFADCQSFLIDLPGFTTPIGGKGTVHVEARHKKPCTYNELRSVVRCWDCWVGDGMIAAEYGEIPMV